MDKTFGLYNNLLPTNNMFLLTTFLSVWLVLAQAADRTPSIYGERRLETVELLNAVLADYTIEIPTADLEQNPFSAAGVTMTLTSPITCSGFSVAALAFTQDEDITTVTLDGEELKKVHVDVSGSGLKFTCRVNTRTQAFNVNNGNIVITSNNGGANLNLDLYSPDYGFLIPVRAIANDGVTCANNNVLTLNFQYQFNLGGLAGLFANALAPLFEPFVNQLIAPMACEQILSLANNFTALVEQNPLTEFKRVRTEETITELTLAAENELKTVMPNQAAFYTEAGFQEMGGNMLSSVLQSQYVGKVLIAIGELQTVIANAQVEGALNATALADAVNGLIFVMVDVETNIDGELLETFFNNPLFQNILNMLTQVISGEMSITEFFETVLAQLGLSLDGLLPVLPLVEDETDRQLQGLNIPSIQEVLEALRTSVNYTIGDVVELLGDDASEISDFLLTYGSATNVIAVLEEWISVVESAFGYVGLGFDFGNITDFGVDLSATLPADVVDFLQKVSTFSPDLQPIVDSIVEAGGSLLPVIEEYLTVEIPVEGLVNMVITLASFSLSGKGDSDGLESGFAGEGSLISPRINISDVVITVGGRITLTTEAGDVFEDTVLISGDFGFLVQVSETTSFDFIDISSYPLQDLVDFTSVLFALQTLPLCALSNVYVALGAQKSESTFLASVTTQNGLFDGFIENALKSFLFLYSPFLPTILEGSLEDAVQRTREKGFFNLELGSCDVTIPSKATTGDSDGGSGGDGGQGSGTDDGVESRTTGLFDGNETMVVAVIGAAGALLILGAITMYVVMSRAVTQRAKATQEGTAAGQLEEVAPVQKAEEQNDL